MATNWVIPTGNDVYAVLCKFVGDKANENTGADATAGATFDPAAQNRRNDLVTKLVAAWRGAIRQGGRVPLSVTASALPAQAVVHLLNVVVYQLVCSTPNLQMFVVTEKGQSSPLTELWREGIAFEKKLSRGETVEPPDDPCGIDYLTAADDDPDSVAYNPSLRSVVWGDMNATDQEYAAGEKTDPISGTITILPQDFTTS